MSANAWQIRCTKVLRDIINDPKLAQTQRATEWTNEKMFLAQEQRVILADIDLTNRDLSDFDFSFVYFARVNFSGASLVRTKFKRAIFADCSMRGADLRGGSLWLADIKTMDMAEVKNYERANLNTITPITASNNARPRLIQLGEEHREKYDRLETGSMFAKLLAWTDFGTRLLPTFYTCAVVNLFFALLYWAIEKVLPGTFTFAGAAKGSFDFPTLLLMTLQRFTNSPPLVESANLFVGYLFVLNAIAGVVAVGMFIAQLTRRLVLGSR